MSSPQSQPLNPLACRTLTQVKEALQTGDAASLVQIIQLIREIADKGDTMPVHELAEIIARDLTTISKVLRAANTLGYNPEGVEVTTITQAINIIGFEKVRNLAIALLLVENAEGKSLAEESREVAGLAVTSGLIAQSVVEQREESVLDPEQSFVCAALRNYGKLLLTTFLLEDYRRARQLIGKMDPDAAFRSVFGLTPLELGYEILHEARFPRSILRSLQRVPPERINAPGSSPEDQVVVLAEFAGKLCELIQDSAAPGQFERGSANLLARYGRALNLGSKELPQLLKTVALKLKAIGVVHGVRVFTAPLIKNINALASQGETPATVTPTGGTAPVQKPTGTPRPREILLGGLAEVAQLVATQPVDVERILESTRRCVQLALKLSHCLVFWKEGSGPQLSARAGGGWLFDEIRGRPLLDPKAEDIFQAALTQGDDVLIQNSNDPKVAGLVPDWLKAVGRNQTLILLPIRDEAETFALILGVSELLAPLELATQLKPQLKVLRGHVAFVRSMI